MLLIGISAMTVATSELRQAMEIIVAELAPNCSAAFEYGADGIRGCTNETNQDPRERRE